MSVTCAAVALHITLIDTSLFQAIIKNDVTFSGDIFCDFDYSLQAVASRSHSFSRLAYYYKRRFMFLYIPRALTVGVYGRDLSPNTSTLFSATHLCYNNFRVVSCLLRSDKYVFCCVLVLWRKMGVHCSTVPFCFSPETHFCTTDTVSFVQNSLLSSLEVWQFSGTFAELRKWLLASPFLSVRPSSAPTKRIALNFIFQYIYIYIY
jgi:hypothetical protein